LGLFDEISVDIAVCIRIIKGNKAFFGIVSRFFLVNCPPETTKGTATTGSPNGSIKTM